MQLVPNPDPCAEDADGDFICDNVDDCVGTYYPEMNPLIPLWYHDKLSKTPAAKGVPVRIVVADDAP